MKLLWFAFRLYLWLIDSQLENVKMKAEHRCDLLSDCIFDLLIHSERNFTSSCERVVICFQIVSLTYWFTAAKELRRIVKGCDLLSDCIFDLLIHSYWIVINLQSIVVICFQIVSLTYWFTAGVVAQHFTDELWFAFRLYLWLIDSQRFRHC